MISSNKSLRSLIFSFAALTSFFISSFFSAIFFLASSIVEFGEVVADDVLLLIFTSLLTVPVVLSSQLSVTFSALSEWYSFLTPLHSMTISVLPVVVVVVVVFDEEVSFSTRTLDEPSVDSTLTTDFVIGETAIRGKKDRMRGKSQMMPFLPERIMHIYFIMPMQDLAFSEKRITFRSTYSVFSDRLSSRSY